MQGLFNSCCPLGFMDGEEKKNYTRHYKRLCTLLGAAGPGSLAKRLKSRELVPSQVAAMPDEDLRSEAQRKQQSAARNEGLQAALLAPAPPAAVTEDYTCPKCGQLLWDGETWKARLETLFRVSDGSSRLRPSATSS
eukprot:s1765_g9.t1